LIASVCTLDGEVLEWHKGNTAERMLIAAGPVAGRENAPDVHVVPAGGAYVPTVVVGMYAASRKGRRHAKVRHVCATRANSFS
jgi:hypothetical protein